MKKILACLFLLSCASACAHRVSPSSQVPNRKSIIEFRLVHETPANDRVEAPLPHPPGKGFLGPVEMSLADIASASFASRTNPGGNGPISTIELVMTPEGAVKFATLTRANIKRRLAILVKGAVLTAPVIFEEIQEGKAVIVGRFTEEEARRTAAEIEAAIRSSNQAL